MRAEFTFLREISKAIAGIWIAGKLQAGFSANIRMNRISSPDHSRAAPAAASKPIVGKGKDLNELALFAGAGGGILGGKLLGWKTVCAVEIEPYAARVLAARQNDGCLPPFPIWDDIRSFDGRPWRGLVDVVSGGFPCQDISCAGRRAGIDGERSGLWREMARIIREVGPRFAFVENSPMLTVRGLGRVLGDLAAMGYDARWCVLGAANAGAPHQRDRIWILAHTDRPAGRIQSQPEARSGEASEPGFDGQDGTLAHATCSRNRPVSARSRPERQGATDIERSRPALADSNFDGRDSWGQGDAAQKPGGRQSDRGACRAHPLGHTDRARPQIGQGQLCDDGKECATTIGANWWKSEPRLGRVADGVADRVDRLKAIGNGQVPQVAALAWSILMGDGFAR